jgi:hypothetical protein
VWTAAGSVCPNRVAHSVGLRSNVTIMFGSVEAPRKDLVGWVYADPAGGRPAVVAVDRLLDVGGGGHRGPHRAQLGGQADVVKGEHVGRVGQGDREHVVGQGDRDGVVAQGHVAGEHGQRLVGDGQAAQVQEGQAELVGEGAGDLDLVGQAEGDDDLPQPPATALVLALDAQRLVQLRLGEDLPGDQHLAEPATPDRRPASGPARAHLGGSPLSWFRARPGSIGSRGPRVDVRRPSPRHWPP